MGPDLGKETLNLPPNLVIFEKSLWLYFFTRIFPMTSVYHNFILGDQSSTKVFWAFLFQSWKWCGMRLTRRYAFKGIWKLWLWPRWQRLYFLPDRLGDISKLFVFTQGSRDWGELGMKLVSGPVLCSKPNPMAVSLQREQYPKSVA